MAGQTALALEVQALRDTFVMSYKSAEMQALSQSSSLHLAHRALGAQLKARPEH